MKINDIDIPEAEIAKLALMKQKILYCIHWAKVIRTVDLYRAGGTGCQTRRKKLNELFLSKYGLRICKAPVKGETQWEYFFQKVGDLPFRAMRRDQQAATQASVRPLNASAGQKVV